MATGEGQATQEQINAVLRAKHRAQRAIAYVDTIKMDVQQIEGTRYKFRFSETPTER